MLGQECALQQQTQKIKIQSIVRKEEILPATSCRSLERRMVVSPAPPLPFLASSPFLSSRLSFHLLGFQRLFIVGAVPEEFVGLAEEEVDLAEEDGTSSEQCIEPRANTHE